MSTHDVPGANPRNADVLAAGCWAEHEDGSLIFVKGTEGGSVVYEIYDVAQDPPVAYTDAMTEVAFKKQFTYKSGVSTDKWTWHDKTPFPWDRVMKVIPRPRPQFADAHQTISAAQRVADSLRLRAREVQESDVSHRTDTVTRRGLAVLERIANALDKVTISRKRKTTSRR